MAQQSYFTKLTLRPFSRLSKWQLCVTLMSWVWVELKLFRWREWSGIGRKAGTPPILRWTKDAPMLDINDPIITSSPTFWNKNWRKVFREPTQTLKFLEIFLGWPIFRESWGLSTFDRFILYWKCFNLCQILKLPLNFCCLSIFCYSAWTN